MSMNGRYSRRSSCRAGKVLIPGVIDTVTNFVEHPELVAQRIERWARLVGRKMSSPATTAALPAAPRFVAVHPDIVWMKMQVAWSRARGWPAGGLW